MQQFTQYGGARPFGVAMMVAGINDKIPELYVSDITGNYLLYHANAIGENDEKIKDKLRDEFKPGLTLKKGVKLALDIFKEIQDKKFELKKFELAYIKNDDLRVNRKDGEELNEFLKH